LADIGVELWVRAIFSMLEHPSNEFPANEFPSSEFPIVEFPELNLLACVGESKHGKIERPDKLPF